MSCARPPERRAAAVARQPRSSVVAQTQLTALPSAAAAIAQFPPRASPPDILSALAAPAKPCRSPPQVRSPHARDVFAAGALPPVPTEAARASDATRRRAPHRTPHVSRVSWPLVSPIRALFSLRPPRLTRRMCCSPQACVSPQGYWRRSTRAQLEHSLADKLTPHARRSGVASST